MQKGLIRSALILFGLFLGISTIELLFRLFPLENKWSFFSLVDNLYHNNILGVSEIYRLSKDNYEVLEKSDLEYFYQPKPNSIENTESQFGDKGRSLINSDGLNERFDYLIDKAEETFRVMTLGDSFTFGSYVKTEENYPEQLEDMLDSNNKCQNYKKFEVINLGVPGYDLRYALERFKVKGQKYNPDLVIWLITDDFVYLREDYGRRYKSCLNLAGVSNLDTDIIPQDLVQLCGGKAMSESTAQIPQKDIIKYQVDSINALETYFLKDLVLVSLGPIPAEAITQRNFGLTEKNIYFYDIAKDLDQSGTGMFLSDGHPSVKGHLEIARYLYKFLSENNLISCN